MTMPAPQTFETAPGGAVIWPPSPGLPTLSAGDHVHLVGVGGAGMSGLARVLVARGLAVSGSDRYESPLLAALAAVGVTVHVGHGRDRVPPDCTLVVRSPAVPDANPEIQAARAAGIPITKRAVMLGALMDAGTGLAFAGTHGKTTTSAMAAYVLTRAGLDPTFFVGGEIPDLGTNARSGEGRHIIVEADEYDRSFLHGHPAVAVITNVEHDHPDIYPTLSDVEDAFRAFATRVKPDGRLVVNVGSHAAWSVSGEAPARIDGYWVEGDPPPPDGVEPTWTACDVGGAGPEHQGFEVRRGERHLGRFLIRLPGRHNVSNALAVIAAMHTVGVDIDVVRAALADFVGADRRYQVVGRAGGVTVVDDYAHHPTEITATVEAARQRHPAGRVWAVVQPHTYSRVAALAPDYASAVLGADRAVITPIYASREAPIPGVSADRIAREAPGSHVAPDMLAAADWVAAEAERGDVLLFMGAGDIPRASQACLRALRDRALQRLLEEATRRALGGSVSRTARLSEYTTLRVGGPADALVRVCAIADLIDWLRLARAMDVPVRLVGRGSNVLARDGGFRGLVILNRCEGWSITADAGDEAAEVLADSGVTLASLGHTLARDGWAGIEAGVGIPGSLGAGVVTNAGAHGWSMADSVAWAEILDADGTVRRWPNEALGFVYRGSALKGDPVRAVLRVALRVRREEPDAIRSRIARHTEHRRATQPATHSAGSMFKNPPGDYAGRLIEACGLKGLAVGGAEISTVHANFFVNRGDARARDVLQLIEIARARVRDRFGVTLELEIEPLGENGDR